MNTISLLVNDMIFYQTGKDCAEYGVMDCVRRSLSWCEIHHYSCHQTLFESHTQNQYGCLLTNLCLRRLLQVLRFIVPPKVILTGRGVLFSLPTHYLPGTWAVHLTGRLDLSPNWRYLTSLGVHPCQLTPHSFSSPLPEQVAWKPRNVVKQVVA